MTLSLKKVKTAENFRKNSLFWPRRQFARVFKIGYKTPCLKPNVNDDYLWREALKLRVYKIIKIG